MQKNNMDDITKTGPVGLTGLKGVDTQSTPSTNKYSELINQANTFSQAIKSSKASKAFLPIEDIEGIGKARMALTKLAEMPGKRGNGSINRNLISELYTEIRASRIAGHSWAKIAKCISDGIPSIKVSDTFLKNTFMQIDKEWEEKTGVKALPRSRYKKREKQKK